MFQAIFAVYAYLLGPAPDYIWCESRNMYRNVGTYLFPGEAADYLPAEYILPPRQPSSLYGDAINAYHSFRYEALAARRGAVNVIYMTLRSPVTYGVCPDDPDPYETYWLVLGGFGIGLVAALLFRILWRLSHAPYRYVCSIVLWLTSSIEINNTFYRSSFSNLPSPLKSSLPGHSHPDAAAQRNADALFLRQLALSTGCTPYSVQCSAADQRNNLRGSREYYWGKDVAQPPRLDTIPEDAMFLFVDVDQYIDMPYFLANNTRPVAIATVQPTACAQAAGEFSFCFDRDSTLHYYVSGGADYHHAVWDYNTDCLTASRYFCYVPYATTVYNVDRRTSSTHHDVVFLTPSAHWNVFAALANWILQPQPLQRYDLLRGTHLRMLIKTVKGMFISTSLPGQFAVATVPAALDNTISNLSVVSKSGLTRASVETHLPIAVTPEDKERNREASTILYDFYKHNSERLSVSEFAASVLQRLSGGAFNLRQPTMTAPCENAPQPRRYQFGDYDPEAKPNLRAFMQPLIDQAFAPDKTPGNEERARDKRIVAVRSEQPLTPFLTICMEEFLALLVPVPHLLSPLDHSEVYERQARPSQRTLLEEADITGEPNRKAKSFIKSEPYPDVKDPRLITTYNSKDKMEYSRYLYAVSDWLKTIDSYAFGKSPNEISEAVATLCTFAQLVCKTDFTRFDGTMSPATREFETALLYRLFSPSFHQAVQVLHKAQYNLFAICSLGTVYEMLYARGSGSAETSAFNTMVNMFATYVGHRMSPGDYCKFRTPLDAWERTKRGLYGGDDGLSPDVNVEGYVKACTLLGLVVKADNLQRGATGVEFLSRVYGPDVWTGDSSNCCNLLRQLSKVHTTGMRPDTVTVEQMLVDKMAGYALSDANTPVIGPFATKVMAVNSGNLVPDMLLSNWVANQHIRSTAFAEETEVFNNPKRDWYYEYAHLTLAEFDFAGFQRWLDSCVVLSDFLKAPLCMPWKVPNTQDVPFVADGELYTPVTSANVTVMSEKHGPGPKPKFKRKEIRPSKGPSGYDRRHATKATGATRAGGGTTSSQAVNHPWRKIGGT
jgi:hypothetical protein